VGLVLSALVFYSLEGWGERVPEPAVVKVWDARLGTPPALEQPDGLKVNLTTYELRRLAPRLAVASTNGELPAVFCAPLWQLADLAVQGRIAVAANKQFDIPDSWTPELTRDGKVSPTYAVPAFTAQLCVEFPDSFLQALPREWRDRVVSGGGLAGADIIALLELTSKSKDLPGFGKQLSMDPYLLGLMTTAMGDRDDKVRFATALLEDVTSMPSPPGIQAPVIGLSPDLPSSSTVIAIVRDGKPVGDCFGYGIAALGPRLEEQLVPLAQKLAKAAAGMADGVGFRAYSVQSAAGVSCEMAPWHADKSWTLSWFLRTGSAAELNKMPRFWESSRDLEAQ
jgi:hypothetical protein